MPRFVEVPSPVGSTSDYNLLVRVRLDRSISTPQLKVDWRTGSDPSTPGRSVPAVIPMGVGHYRGVLEAEMAAVPPLAADGRSPVGVPSRPYAVLTLPPFAPGDDGRGGFAYLEATIEHLPAGTDVTYSIEVLDLQDPDPNRPPLETLGPYVVRAPQPELQVQGRPADTDLVGGRSGSLTDPEPVWIARVRRVPGVVQIVVDLDDIPVISPDSEIPVRVKVGAVWHEADPAAVHRKRQRLGAGSDTSAVRLPLVDVNTDRVTFTIPCADPSAPVVVEVYGRQVLATRLGGPGETRLLITHFAIQAMNDLFARPLSSYSPPRTYMQVTMRDEAGLYSSRPGVAASGSGDGYSYGFDAHRRFGVPYHLALNGPLLTMIAHDCPTPEVAGRGVLHAGLDTLRSDVRGGLLHPMLPGYGSFRWRWFRAPTLSKDVELGQGQMEHLLYTDPETKRPNVLYPDSRIYVGTPQYVSALAGLKKDLGVEYVVWDSATGYYGNESTITREPGFTSDAGPNYLWQEEKTGVRILFIDDSLKDTIYADDKTRWEMGKPPLAVRRRLLRFAIDPRLRRNLLCYGDDYEKACSNGWFEGQGPLKERFAAFLEWVAAHSWWLTVVTTADLEDDEVVGTMDVRSSLEPTMDPGGADSVDLKGRRFHFDTWMATWATYQAAWRGGSLGGITREVERALIAPPTHLRNRGAQALVETAWLAFCTLQHEQGWMKQTLEAGDPNRTPLGEPESFTVSSGLQVRTVLVWLKAALWAQWAESARVPTERTFASGGPLTEAIAKLGSEEVLRGRRPHPLFDTEHWDADPLDTPYLYNRSALVVLDRNGGVATHVFVRDDNGRVRTVSGTFKTYQFRTDDGLFADGLVMQNTVWTPNHRYIGSIPSTMEGPRVVDIPDVRTGSSGNVDHTLMVNNFDAYDVASPPLVEGATSARVSFTYRAGKQAPRTIDRQGLERLLRRDGRARREGRETDAVVWHSRPGTLVKTFTLTGTTLTVDIEGVTPEDVVESEVCVDLWAGAMEGALLERESEQDAVTIRVAGDPAGNDGRGVRLRIVSGGALTRASRLDTLDAATQSGEEADYLELHRVLTEAFRITPISDRLTYELDLRYQPTNARGAVD